MSLPFSCVRLSVLFLIMCNILLFKEFEHTGVWEDISQKEEIWQKRGKTAWNWGKKAKYGLKIKEKAEILAYGNFEKRGNQLKRGTLTPLDIIIF